MKRLINLTGWLISIVLLVLIFINNNHSQKQSAKYYINIPDSPNIKGAWKELDYISNDTAYYNWYWRE